MANKSKKSVTKSTMKVNPAASQDAPVEDQAKVTKKKGRPAKTVTEETPREEISEDPELSGSAEEDTQDGDVEAEATSSNKENTKPGPGSRSKQKKAGLTFPILKMKQNLKKGKSTLRMRCLLDISDILLSRQLPDDQPQQVGGSHLPGRCAGVPHC